MSMMTCALCPSVFHARSYHLGAENGVISETGLWCRWLRGTGPCAMGDGLAGVQRDARFQGNTMLTRPQPQIW